MARPAAEPLPRASVFPTAKPAYHGVVGVGCDKTEAEAARIEKNQKTLRDSIEQTKRLAEEAERLVQQNRQRLRLGDTRSR